MSAFTKKLIHTCTIQERTGTSSVDDWQGEEWTDVDGAASVPCLHQNQNVREYDNRTHSSVVVMRDVLYMVYRTVTEKNRITDVKDRNGETLYDGPFDIESRIDMAGQGRFLKLMLRKAGR